VVGDRLLVLGRGRRFGGRRRRFVGVRRRRRSFGGGARRDGQPRLLQRAARSQRTVRAFFGSYVARRSSAQKSETAEAPKRARTDAKRRRLVVDGRIRSVGLDKRARAH